MKSRSFFVVVGLLVITIIVLAFFAGGRREPIYQGRRLSEYLPELGTLKPGPSAMNAIKETGTNALPFLMHEIQTKDPIWKHRLAVILQKQKLFRFEFRQDSTRRWNAVFGFRALGPTAKTALPGLTKLLQDTNYASEAAAAISYLGPEALEVLSSALKSRHLIIRRSAAGAFKNVTADRTAMINMVLAEALNDQDSIVRSDLQVVLQAQPDVAIKYLISLLHSTNSQTRVLAALELNVFGNRAQQAVPALIKLVYDRDIELQNQARFAIIKIVNQPQKNGSWRYTFLDRTETKDFDRELAKHYAEGWALVHDFEPEGPQTLLLEIENAAKQ